VSSAFDVHLNGRVGMAALDSGASLEAFGGLLLFALGVGVALAQAFHEPFHHPLGLLLPAARRQLGAAHGSLILAVAAVFAVAVHLLQTNISWMALFGLMVGLLSLWVPIEPQLRWQGSRLAFFGLGGLLIFSSFHAWQMREFLVSRSALVGATGLAVAVLCFALGYSRRRLRERAAMPWKKPFASREAGEKWVWRIPIMSWGTARAAADHPLAQADGSTWSWVRLIFYEYYGKGAWRGGFLLFIPFSMFLVFLGTGYWSGRYLPAVIHYGSYSAVRSLAVRQHEDLQRLIMLMIGTLAGTTHSVWPKMDAVYPFSRRERFRIVAAWSVAQAVLFLVVFLFGVFGLKYGKMLAAEDFATLLVMKVGLLLALIVAPLMQWGALYRSRRRMHAAGALFAAGWLVLVVVMSVSGPSFIAALFSPVGLLLAAGLAAGLYAAYFSALRRVCLKEDLVLRSE
jgi:hypothetical protein